MKHWTANVGLYGIKQPMIGLIDGDGGERGDNGRVLIIYREENSVVFVEGCDQHFSIEFPVDEAREALREASEWIDAQFGAVRDPALKSLARETIAAAVATHEKLEVAPQCYFALVDEVLDALRAAGLQIVRTHDASPR